MIVPLPDPLALPVIVNQLDELAAVHEQLPPAVTLTLPVTAVGVTVRDVGDKEYAHPPFCVMLNLANPTVSVADRDDVELFAVML